MEQSKKIMIWAQFLLGLFPPFLTKVLGDKGTKLQIFPRRPESKDQQPSRVNKFLFQLQCAHHVSRLCRRIRGTWLLFQSHYTSGGKRLMSCHELWVNILAWQICSFGKIFLDARQISLPQRKICLDRKQIFLPLYFFRWISFRLSFGYEKDLCLNG